jgi:hypothetical protein
MALRQTVVKARDGVHDGITTEACDTITTEACDTQIFAYFPRKQPLSLKACVAGDCHCSCLRAVGAKRDGVR